MKLVMRNKTFKRNALSTSIMSAVAIVGGLSSSQLYAATETKTQATTLEEVIVTSRRMAESLQQTPLSVTAIDGEKLNEMGVQSFDTLDAFTPNLVTAGTAGNGGNVANFSIRGIGGDPGGFITKEGGVGVYIDDIYFARPNGGLLDLIDVESIEVLRGPQGTLFGRNTSGGAIRFVTTKPEVGELSGKIKGALGEFNRQDITAVANIPLTDNLATRISLASKQRDGHVVRTIDGLDTGNQDLSAAKMQLRWQPGKWDMNFTLDTLSDYNNGPAIDISEVDPNAIVPTILGEPGFADIVTESPYTVLGGDRDSTSYEAWGFTSSIAYDISDTMGFKSLTGYRTAEQDTSEDWDKSPYDIWKIVGEVDIEYFTQEFQLNGSSFDRRLDWVAGVFFMEEQPYQFRNRYNPTTGGLPQPEMRDQKVSSYAVFGQGTYSITDKLSTTLGLRWSRDEKDFVGQRGDETGANSDSWDSVSPRVGLEYQWTDAVMTYVSAAHGFKSGGFNDRPRPGYSNSGIIPYDPENLWTYEAGMRTDLFDSKARLNATFFYTDYQDMQIEAIILDEEAMAAVAITQNAGAATLQGMELDMQWLVMEGWQLNAAFGWTDAAYDDVGTAVNLTLDSEFGLVPEFSYTVGSSYSYYTDDGTELAFNVNYGWKDEQRSSDSTTNSVHMDAYGLLNARLAYLDAGGQWSLALVGTNLTDEEYLTGGFGNAADGFMGYVQNYIGRPREVGVELTVNF